MFIYINVRKINFRKNTIIKKYSRMLMLSSIDQIGIVRKSFELVS